MRSFTGRNVVVLASDLARGRIGGVARFGLAGRLVGVKDHPKRHSPDQTLDHLNRAGEVLAVFAIAGVVGVAVGIGFAHYLRTRNLKWTWALLTVPPLAGIATAFVALGADAVHAAAAIGFAPRRRGRIDRLGDSRPHR